MRRSLGLIALLAGCAGGPDEPGCDEGGCDGLPDGAIAAECTAEVVGVGSLDTEAAYLPQVVACENGDGSDASLRAQAIAARSYLYFKMQTDGEIEDGQSDQVFTCNRKVEAAHRRAVEDTRGQVLSFRGTQVAAFYVAGALPPSGSTTCRGGVVDPSKTEKFVTYNEGKSGDAIQQTRLGFVHPTNHANRGCLSQHGANCLAAQGRATEEILRFYYGEDIELVRAVGACVPPAAELDPVEEPIADLEPGAEIAR
jgi:hypothetical protein